jgi:hypothetical protein
VAGGSEPLEGEMASGGITTVRVKVCVAAGGTPLFAVIVRVYVPFVPAAGVPERRAVLGPLPAKVTPVGRAPISVKVTFG